MTGLKDAVVAGIFVNEPVVKEGGLNGVAGGFREAGDAVKDGGDVPFFLEGNGDESEEMAEGGSGGESVAGVGIGHAHVKTAAGGRKGEGAAGFLEAGELGATFIWGGLAVEEDVGHFDEADLGFAGAGMEAEESFVTFHGAGPVGDFAVDFLDAGEVVEGKGGLVGAGDRGGDRFQQGGGAGDVALGFGLDVEEDEGAGEVAENGIAYGGFFEEGESLVGLEFGGGVEEVGRGSGGRNHRDGPKGKEESENADGKRGHAGVQKADSLASGGEVNPAKPRPVFLQVKS